MRPRSPLSRISLTGSVIVISYSVTEDIVMTVLELEREVWNHIRQATEKHDAPRLAHFSALAAEIDAAKSDWIARVEAGRNLKAGGHAVEDRRGARLERQPAVGPDEDFTGRPIRGFEFDGTHLTVTTYKDLLIQLA